MALEFRNVVKRVNAETHIHETNFSLKSGMFNILLGTTLSGKTSLIQLMAGLTKPTSGEIWLDGKNITNMSVQKRNISMVHQQFINYPNFSIFDNIASPLKVAGLARDEIRTRVSKVADLLQLTPMLDRRPSELSGGQQQRTALARALVKDSSIVLLDEPLANLDYKLREELRDELPKLFEHRDTIIVYATSEPEEALLLGGQTATLHEGRITQFGLTPTVYRDPDNLRTAKVFSDPPINSAPVIKRNGYFFLNEVSNWPAPETQQALPDGEYIMAIRPHQIVPIDMSEPEHAVRVSGKVLVTEISGSESVVRFDLDGQTWISQSAGIHATPVGSEAAFFIDVSKCLYFNTDGRRAGAAVHGKGTS